MKWVVLICAGLAAPPAFVWLMYQYGEAVYFWTVSWSHPVIGVLATVLSVAFVVVTLIVYAMIKLIDQDGTRKVGEWWRAL